MQFSLRLSSAVGGRRRRAQSCRLWFGPSVPVKSGCNESVRCWTLRPVFAQLPAGSRRSWEDCPRPASAHKPRSGAESKGRSPGRDPGFHGGPQAPGSWRWLPIAGACGLPGVLQSPPQMGGRDVLPCLGLERSGGQVDRTSIPCLAPYWPGLSL